TPGDLLRTLPDAAAIPRAEQPTRTTVRTGTAETLVVTAPTNNGKWWVLFRQPTASAYAAARGTRASIFLWALLLFGATVSLLLLFRHRLNQRITEPVKAAGPIASRGARGGRRRGQDPAHRDGARGGVGRLGAPQHHRRGPRPAPQAGARSEHRAARQAGRGSGAGLEGGGGAGPSRGGDPEVRDADQGD